MPRPRFTTTALALASTCLIAPWAMAQEQAGSPALKGSMLAFSRSSGQLTIYNLATQESRDVGQAHTVRDQNLVGVEAAAYLPGQANVYAF